MRVLFTGLGSIGRRHLRIVQEEWSNAECLAYWSGKSDRPTPAGVSEFSDLDTALASDPDMAFITNPTALHVETAHRCADAGCDLFIEKPLSHSRDGVDGLIETVDNAGVVTHVGCQLRFHPVIREVRAALDEGRVGDVYSFRAFAGSYLPEWRPEQDYRESYSAKPELGGGVVLDLIHEIDYSHWLFGPIETVTGYADQVSHLDVETEDIAEFVCRTETGQIGSIHLDYVRRTGRRDLEIIGEYGVIEADLNAGTVTVDGENGQSTAEFEFERDDLFRRQLSYVRECVDSRESSMNDLTEAKRVLEVALEVVGR